MDKLHNGESLVVVPSLGEPVGKLWRDLQAKNTRTANFYVSAPLSSTPLSVYDWIIRHAEQFPRWDKVCFVLMDEQVEGSQAPFQYISADDPASYERFAHEHFIKPLGKQVALLKPDLDQLDTFHTPIDLLVLALGVQGNYANVMLGTPVETGWHIAHLISEFRQAHTGQNSNSYAGANFREYGMSLGPQQVLSAKHVVVIISGKSKRELARRLFARTRFDPEFPLSIIHHPDVRQRVSCYVTEDVLERTAAEYE